MLNEIFLTIAAAKHRVTGYPGDAAESQTRLHGAPGPQASRMIDDTKHCDGWHPTSRCGSPSRELFGDRVKVLDSTLFIRCDHPFTNRMEHHAQSFNLLGQLGLHALALGHILNHRQREQRAAIRLCWMKPDTTMSITVPSLCTA
jgi:hypothetical protein